MKTIVNEKERRDLTEIAENARKEKAEKMLYAGNIVRICDKIETYVVGSQSKKDMRYVVECIDLEKYSCTCPDYIRQSQINKNHRCKHILLVQIAEEYSFIKRELSGKKSFKEDEYSF